MKKKLKKRQRESEDEDSRIDRHELKEGGGKGCLPSPIAQLLSSSPSHGRMKTFVVTFTFGPLVSLLSKMAYLNLIICFRLCNLGTLKRSHTAQAGRGGGSEEEDGVGSGGPLGGEVHHHKPAREKALGLGDISSDSGGSRVSDKPSESEEESPRTTVGQVMIQKRSFQSLLIFKYAESRRPSQGGSDSKLKRRISFRKGFK